MQLVAAVPAPWDSFGVVLCVCVCVCVCAYICLFVCGRRGDVSVSHSPAGYRRRWCRRSTSCCRRRTRGSTPLRTRSCRGGPASRRPSPPDGSPSRRTGAARCSGCPPSTHRHLARKKSQINEGKHVFCPCFQPSETRVSRCSFLTSFLIKVNPT